MQLATVQMRTWGALTCLLSLLTFTPASAQINAPVKITIGNYVPSEASSVVSMPLLFLQQRKDIQNKYNIELQVEGYSNLNALYTDMARGRLDAQLTGPAPLAAVAAKGAPIAIAGTLARISHVILSNGKPWTRDALKGSRLVTQSASSSWKVMNAIIQRNFDLRADKDYEVVNSDSTAAAAIQVATGSADYAVVRAEQVLLATKKYKNLKIVADAEALGRVKGTADWGYLVAYNTKNLKYEQAARLVAAMAEVAEWMKAHPDDVDALAVKEGQEKGIAREFLTSGAVRLSILPPSAAREELTGDFELLKSTGYLEAQPPASVFPQ